MQLLGKHYFGNDSVSSDAALLESASDANGMPDDGGLETLCEAVEGGHKVPAWMAAAAGMVRDNRKHLIAAASVLVIGFAVYLNWAMAGDGNDSAAGGADALGVSEMTDGGMSEADGLAADVPVAEGGAADDYFAVSQINRQRARDEAIAVLQDVVDGAANLSDVQSDALAQISQIAADIEREAAIESLVRGKGFSDCVAVISGGNANVIVRSSALLPNEVAQIQEIVYETAGILPANVKIIEK